MADTLPNILIPADVWVDLYAESGIAAGTAIVVENIGVSDVLLTVSATQPPHPISSSITDAYNIVKREGGNLKNSSGSTGAWAFSDNCDGKVSVRRSEINEGFYPELSNISFDDVTISSVVLKNAAGIVVNPATIEKQQEIIDALAAVTTAEDEPSADGQKGIPAMAVANEALADLVSDDTDETRISTDKKGVVYTRNEAELAQLQGINLELDTHTLQLASIDDELVIVNAELADQTLELQEINTKLGGITTTEDTASADGQKGIPAMAVANEAQTELVDADGDEARLSTDKKGNLYTRPLNLEAATGTISDAEAASGDGTMIALLKRLRTLLGTAGAGAATILGTGVIGWLRAIYDKLALGISLPPRIEITDWQYDSALNVGASDETTEIDVAASPFDQYSQFDYTIEALDGSDDVITDTGLLVEVFLVGIAVSSGNEKKIRSFRVDVGQPTRQFQDFSAGWRLSKLTFVNRGTANVAKFRIRAYMNREFQRGTPHAAGDILRGDRNVDMTVLSVAEGVGPNSRQTAAGAMSTLFQHLVTTEIDPLTQVEFANLEAAGVALTTKGDVTVTNGGTVDIVNGDLVLSTGTTLNGSAKFVSNVLADYNAAEVLYYPFTLCAPDNAPVTGDMFAGPLADDFSDGYVLGYRDRELGLFYFNSDVLAAFPVDARRGVPMKFIPYWQWNDDNADGFAGSLFTLDGSPYAMDLSLDRYLFWVEYGFLGKMGPTIKAFAPDNHPVPLHEILGGGLGKNFSNPNLPFTYFIENLEDDSTDRTVHSGSYALLQGGSRKKEGTSVNATSTAGGGLAPINTTVYTVTSGRKFRMNDLVLTVTNLLSTGGVATVRDGGVGGTIKMNFTIVPGTNQTKQGVVIDHAFNEPIDFYTDITVVVPAIGIGANLAITISGDEVDL